MKTGFKARIEVADVLRGFAVMSILLLHSIEHFNFYSFPDTQGQCAILNFTDRVTWDGMFFAFGGKAYAVFALLFGFSFYIMDKNQQQRGNDFRLRFCWRLVLLFLLGNLNAAFFTGEVLVLYSLIGFILPLVCRLKDRTVLILAACCMLQPLEIYKLISGLINPDTLPEPALASLYFQKAFSVQESGNFWETLKMNLWDGQLASLTWAWENGRMFQTASLFMLGMIVGRRGWFIDTVPNRYLWGKVLGVALLMFFPLYGLANLLKDFIQNPVIFTPLHLIISSLHKFAFMLILVTSVMFAFYCTQVGACLGGVMSYGKMSLTNYIMQSIVGSMLYYNWGFALHNDLGITASIAAGAVFLVLQFVFCKWWMQRFDHGPLENLWKKATWIKF